MQKTRTAIYFLFNCTFSFRFNFIITYNKNYLWRNYIEKTFKIFIFSSSQALLFFCYCFFFLIIKTYSKINNYIFSWWKTFNSAQQCLIIIITMIVNLYVFLYIVLFINMFTVNNNIYLFSKEFQFFFLFFN
jgi:hypothetical protein